MARAKPLAPPLKPTWTTTARVIPTSGKRSGHFCPRCLRESLNPDESPRWNGCVRVCACTCPFVPPPRFNRDRTLSLFYLDGYHGLYRDQRPVCTSVVRLFEMYLTALLIGDDAYRLDLWTNCLRHNETIPRCTRDSLSRLVIRGTACRVRLGGVSPFSKTS